MNIYLDCGFYAGVALQKYLDARVVDDSWTVYAFEPNRELEISTYDFVKVIKKATWIKDGRVKFQLGGRNDASSIEGTGAHGEPRIITVPCIDFSKFVSELPDDSYIICSMDIEGAEFEVLKKMIEEGTIDKINVLDIEFHHRLTPGYTEVSSQQLINYIEERGVEVKLKVALS